MRKIGKTCRLRSLQMSLDSALQGVGKRNVHFPVSAACLVSSQTPPPPPLPVPLFKEPVSQDFVSILCALYQVPKYTEIFLLVVSNFQDKVCYLKTAKNYSLLLIWERFGHFRGSHFQTLISVAFDIMPEFSPLNIVSLLVLAAGIFTPLKNVKWYLFSRSVHWNNASQGVNSVLWKFLYYTYTKLLLFGVLFYP